MLVLPAVNLWCDRRWRDEGQRTTLVSELNGILYSLLKGLHSLLSDIILLVLSPRPIDTAAFWHLRRSIRVHILVFKPRLRGYHSDVVSFFWRASFRVHLQGAKCRSSMRLKTRLLLGLVNLAFLLFFLNLVLRLLELLLGLSKAGLRKVSRVKSQSGRVN